jgi:hypothetical protein
MNSAHATEPRPAEAELNEALGNLETALLTPVIAGELESWARVAQEATAALAERLPAFLKSVLHPQYAEIAKSDAELLPRVQQLIAEDQKVVVKQDAFRTQVSDFVKLASETKKDEARASAERMKLEQEGLDLILCIKRQRAAASTWLSEANYRDRGPVD